MLRTRVLVWGLSNNRAGTESVISNYVRHLPNTPFDFLCYEEPINYLDLFEGASQNRYFVIPIKIKHPFAYMYNLKKFMHEHGNEYHTLWFNINDMSNIDLLIYAKRYGIKRRITHIHNSKTSDVFITKLFSNLNRKKCLKLTTDRWACSKSAGNFLYHQLSFSIIPNMVNVNTRVFDRQKRSKIRQQWNLMGSLVIGTVGRLATQKNQEFLIRLMPELLKVNPNTKLFIVGDGPLYDKLVSLARNLNVKEHVIFAGSQSDIQGFLSAFDVYAFPSLYEGLSLSILEAQFNGLPCIISEGVGEESIISSNIKTISLRNPADWITELLQAERKDSASKLIPDLASMYDLKNIDKIAPNMFALEQKA